MPMAPRTLASDLPCCLTSAASSAVKVRALVLA
jgi:hypothetical protein